MNTHNTCTRTWQSPLITLLCCLWVSTDKQCDDQRPLIVLKEGEGKDWSISGKHWKRPELSTLEMGMKRGKTFKTKGLLCLRWTFNHSFHKIKTTTNWPITMGKKRGRTGQNTTHFSLISMRIKSANTQRKLTETKGAKCFCQKNVLQQKLGKLSNDTRSKHKLQQH